MAAYHQKGREKLKNPVYALSFLAGVKLILAGVGYDVISDEQVNAIANGISALVMVIATIISPQQKTAAEAKLLQYRLKSMDE